MQYDFDVEPILSPRKSADPKMMALLEEMGVDDTQTAGFQAKFRDKSVIDALNGAASTIREAFEDCGFSWAVSSVDLPPGHVRLQDQDKIAEILSDLQNRLAEFDTSVLNWNGFDLGSFLSAQFNRTPVHDLLGAPRSGTHH
ncbi:MAG: hypothetical protein JXQ89_02120 [Pelagimonas sp.]